MHNLKHRYTIVIVTHNMQQAARVSDRTAFFSLDARERAWPGARGGHLSGVRRRVVGARQRPWALHRRGLHARRPQRLARSGRQVTPRPYRSRSHRSGMSSARSSPSRASVCTADGGSATARPRTIASSTIRVTPVHGDAIMTAAARGHDHVHLARQLDRSRPPAMLRHQQRDVFGQRDGRPMPKISVRSTRLQDQASDYAYSREVCSFHYASDTQAS